MTNQTTSTKTVDQLSKIHTDGFFNNENEINLTEKLQNDLKKLNFLCHNYDPFSGAELSTELENIINEYNLSDYLLDPFQFTNRLLQIMDIAENQIKEQMQ